MNRSTTVSYSGSFDDSSTAHLDLSNRKKLPKGKVIRSTMVAPARLKEEEVSNNEKEKIEWKNETNSNWVVIKKNKNILVKLNFILDRSCKVKQDLRAKKNVLMSELRKVPGLIIDELINYYYEPHQHDLTTEIEDFDLYERMKTFQMQDNHRGYYKNVVNELIASEKTYIQGLDIILSVYLDTLIAASKKGAKDLVTIREQISSIHQRHQEFLSNLNRALITNPECPLIGDIIVNFSPSLESCAEYIFNYPTYLEQVTSMMTESNLALTSKAAESYKKSHNDCPVQHIQQYLITPIQRTPRYVLLITDLLRNISMSFGDAPKLIEAHRAIKRVATTINAKGHEYEADEKLRFVNTILTDFTPRQVKREFICCGPMYVISNKVSSPTVWKYLFLFSDLLVVTEVTHHLGQRTKEKTETMFESLLRVPELKDLRESKFEVEQIIRFYNDTIVDFEEDTKFIHNMFTIKENNDDLLSETITLASTISDCSVAWFTAIKSCLKHFVNK